MRKCVIVFSLSLCIGLLVGCASTAPIKEARSHITLITDDQRELQAMFYPARFPKVAGVILLPDTRCDCRNFGTIPSKLNEEGTAVLAMDFRYKNLISKTRSTQEAISTIQKQDLNSLVDHDLKAALDFMSKQEWVNPERICLIGTSLGSRVALVAGAKYKVRGLVLVSLSGEEALPGGKPIKSLLEDFGKRPIFFVTAEEDWGGDYKAAAHNRQYFEWANSPKELKVWPGAGHGVELIEPPARLEVLMRWLREQL
jgi:dienelactone hydrolase